MPGETTAEHMSRHARLQVGYLAFGPATQDIITFNLPQDWTTAAVKLSLCVGLFFTFSPMMIPVYQIVERGLASQVGAPSLTVNMSKPWPSSKLQDVATVVVAPVPEQVADT